MKVVKKIIAIILEIAFVFLILWFVLGYINFGNIADGKEPVYIVKESQYEVENGTVQVYDNIIYKIVVYRSHETKYSLKLWFMKDI